MLIGASSGLGGVLAAASLLVTAAGLVVAGLGAVLAGWRTGLRSALELWVGAGLLRLGMTSSWQAILIAAGVVGARQVLAAAVLRTPPDDGQRPPWARGRARRRLLPSAIPRGD